MNILNAELDVMNIVNTMDTDVPSPNTVYDVVDLNLDLDFDLDFDLNHLTVNSSIMFDCPAWMESDTLSKELADSILTEDIINIENNASTVWNDFQEIEQFYYEDDSSSILNKNASDLFIFEVEPSQESNTSPTNEFNFEFLSDNFDMFKHESLELDLFNECFKDVQEITQSTEPLVPEYCASINSAVDWNRRRSLLYDKSDFNLDRDLNNSTTTRRRQEVTTRIKAPPTLIPKNQTIEQRAFKCLVRDCEKTYCKASHLKSHMRRHSGVKPFACDWNGCKWRFSRSDELARHKRSHSGIKPYTCNMCEKAFSRSDHLSKHAKVHMKKMALYGTPVITKKCNYKYLSVNRLQMD